MRPRSFGSGRLSLWRVLDGEALRIVPGNPRNDSGDPFGIGRLDPALEDAGPSGVDMAFGDLARFRISFDDRTVTVKSVRADADAATIAHMLDDHVAPRIIAAESGELVLHGSAIEVGGRLAIFLGETGSGKSTLAASFLADGHRLMGDDAVVISASDSGMLGEAVYPSLRLFPESIAEVFGGPVETSSMAFYSDKRQVEAQPVNARGLTEACGDRIPLGAIFILTQGETGVTIDPFFPSDACIALVENSFAFDPRDPAAAAQRMAQAARVAAATPCYELAYPYDFGLLGAVRAQVIALLAPQVPTPAIPA